MEIHNLVQGSPEWAAFRLEHDGASEAAAMLGLSLTTKRDELLRMKKTKIAKEFGDWVQRNVLDHGHEVEALARPHIEVIIGEELYPVTCSDGRQSASCDGLTFDDLKAMEHKQWNERIAAIVAAGAVPPEHMPQCQQVLKVTKAEKLLFVVSDGTPEKMVHVWVFPDAEWFARLDAGWAQFHLDLDAYVPVEIVPPVTARAMESLPALVVRMQGELTVHSNLAEMSVALSAFIERIPENPSTDQEFADTDSACKALKNFEDTSEAKEEDALSQMANVEEFRRVMADLRAVARATRLQREKLVEARKAQIRVEFVQSGQQALAAHTDALNKQLGKAYMPVIPADFGGAIKGKRTVESLRDAVNTTLANAKISADATFRKIQANLTTLRELAHGHAFLFADAGQLVQKATDDVIVIVKARIAEHDKAEADRLEREREAIRQQEREKLEKQQRDEAQAEESLIAGFWRNARRIEGDSVGYVEKAIGMFETAARDFENDQRPRIVETIAAARAEMQGKLATAKAQAAIAQAATPAPAPPAAVTPLQTSPSKASSTPTTASAAVTTPTAAPAADTGATVNITQINAILASAGVATNAASLSQLGFEPIPGKGAARQYLERDLPRMVAAMCEALGHVLETQAA